MNQGSRWKVVAAVVALAGAAGGAWAYLRAHDVGQACAQALSDRKFKDATELCTRAYDRAPSGELAASVAMAYLGAVKMDDAWKWANRPEAKDPVRARRVRAVIKKMRGDEGAALVELDEALKLALARNQPDEAARCAHAAAGLYWKQGRYTDAWQAMEVSAREAERGHDLPALALAELARGDVMRGLGDATRADEYYRRALEASKPWPVDHAYALLRAGTWNIESERYQQARMLLEEALALADDLKNPTLQRTLHENLLRAAVELGDLSMAERHAKVVVANPEQSPEARANRARLLLLEGKADAALGILKTVPLDRPMDNDERWYVRTVFGSAWAAEGRTAEAEQEWLRAVDQIEKTTAAEPAYQGWATARRREPYDRLFESFAARGAYRDAWRVVGRYMLSEALSLERPQTSDERDLVRGAEAARKEWNAPVTPRPEGDDPRELLVLHEAANHLWVGTRHGGEPSFKDAGPISQYEAMLHRFLGDPGDGEAALALGDALWNAAGLAPSAEPLYVAATGRLRKLALSALRHDGRYWIEFRALARVPSLAAPNPVSGEFVGPPVVAGDPRGDLRSAHEEIAWVASQLRAPPLTGSGATLKAVLAARQSAVLHLATHATIGMDGAHLLLADGELSSQQVIRNELRARVVVLASCASAVGRDASGSDSLTTAFLRAGSGAVVGTLRSVPDEAAQKLVRAFYDHGGKDDPVQALAAAQAEVSRTLPASVWGAFVVSVGPAFSK